MSSETRKTRIKRKKVKAILKITTFKPEMLKLPGMILKVYTPVEDASKLDEITITTRREIVDALDKRLERKRREIVNQYPGSFIEITLEGKGFALHSGEYARGYQGTEDNLIYPRPSRLERVGVIDESGRVRWVKKHFRRIYYVYEGVIEVSGENNSVLIETENGRRIHRVMNYSKEMASNNRG